MTTLTVSMSGGLGNQMFQYAMGRALALRHGAALQLDLHGFDIDNFHKRKFELDRFSIPRDLKRVRRPAAFNAARLLRYLSWHVTGIAALGAPWLIIETSFEFDPRHIQRIPARSVYVFGYWQDERYFADAAATLRSEFALAFDLTSANREIDTRIRTNPNAVAVHVRRLHQVATSPGATPREAAEANGLAIGTRYYRDAILAVGERVNNPEYFVFSDYPQWARDNPAFHGIGKLHFFDNDRGPDYEDMALMSHCRHHVVANSSFSWWAAWLGSSPGQVAVAPKNALLMPNIPPGWIRV